jgi:hypothetical protein
MNESVDDKKEGGRKQETLNINYFSVMAALLLLVALSGFARTFFLRPLFGLDPLPPHLYFHGTVLTAWYLLFFTQARLIATRRIKTHRKLGIAGAFVAIAVVAASLLTVFLRDVELIDEYPNLAFGNVSSLIGFALCFASAMILRNRPVFHKRLMVIASIQIAAPALDRMVREPPLYDLAEKVFFWFPAYPPVAFATIATLFLLLSVAAYDLYSERRIKLATLWGIAYVFILGPALSAAVVLTGAWQIFVRAFG